MNSIDHQRWLSDVGRKFPALRDWIRGITPESDYNALLDAWERAMCDLSIDDCLAVNAAMLAGELDGPGNGPPQWQMLPARMRRHAETRRWRREAETGERSVKDKAEHLRTLLIHARRKANVPLAQINQELARAGFERIATLRNANADNPR